MLRAQAVQVLADLLDGGVVGFQVAGVAGEQEAAGPCFRIQYMQQEEKVNQPTTKRWIRLLVPLDNTLPRETIVQPIVTHMCAACAPEHGFNTDAPTIRLMPSIGTITVSSTYEQGDING